MSAAERHNGNNDESSSDVNQRSASSLSTTGAIALALNETGLSGNRSRLSDELHPPPAYSLICPFKADTTNGAESPLDASKLLPPPYSRNAIPHQHQHRRDHHHHHHHHQDCSIAQPSSFAAHFAFHGGSGANSVAHLVRYEELERANVFGGVGAAAAASTDASVSVYAHAVPIALDQLSTSNRLRKQFQLLFPRPYLMRHMLSMIAISLTLISFQIVVMSNDGVLSYFGSGLWSGVLNLLTLLLAMLTLKYTRMWLLVVTIMLHAFCIVISLSGLVVINCVAATRYSACSNTYYYEAFDHHHQEQQHPETGSRLNCAAAHMKYANISMIILGITGMIMFVTFFFKLIAAFNSCQAAAAASAAVSAAVMHATRT